MIGYLGLILLISSYGTLLTKYKIFFVPVSFVASVLLTIHAITISDTVFAIVNGFISGLLLVKLLKSEEEI